MPKIRTLHALLLGIAWFAGAFAMHAQAPERRLVLSPNDVIHVKVFQEDDLESKLRISKEGTIAFPLIGTVKVAGRTSEEAAKLIRDLLAKDYLVNPQVTLSVAEYDKRRYTVLGQVQKPGTYEFPDRETVNLLQAIGLAGGYTRIANASNVTVKRVVDGKEIVIKLDAKSMASGQSQNAFEVRPGDLINVGESIF